MMLGGQTTGSQHALMWAVGRTYEAPPVSSRHPAPWPQLDCPYESAPISTWVATESRG